MSLSFTLDLQRFAELQWCLATFNANTVSAHTADGIKSYAPGQLFMAGFKISINDEGKWDYPIGTCKFVDTLHVPDHQWDSPHSSVFDPRSIFHFRRQFGLKVWPEWLILQVTEGEQK